MPSFKVCSDALTDLEQCVRNRAAVKVMGKGERNFSVNVTLLVEFIDRVGSSLQFTSQIQYTLPQNLLELRTRNMYIYIDGHL